MQAITKSKSAAAPILAIDLGKYKSVACVCRAADERSANHPGADADDFAGVNQQRLQGG